jgi:uncharacterized protein (TIGR02757 family)
MELGELKKFLEEKYLLYNSPAFIETDPVSIPHLFSDKEDIEIAGFLSAAIAWGQRKSILNNANKLMNIMGNSPYDFVMNYSEKQKSAQRIKQFVHRTFNGTDCSFFFESLQNIYKNEGGLEQIFSVKPNEANVYEAICRARTFFFNINHPGRTEKHFSNPATGSAAKRINMFLRWMVRKDHIDFGLWKGIDKRRLICPLDVHSGNVARKLGLLNRKQNDKKSAEELTLNLLILNPKDPVKYDIALFGLGVFEGLAKLPDNKK